MSLDMPYGETKVHVIEIEHVSTPAELARLINDAIRTLEEANRLVQGPVSIQPGRAFDGGTRATLWLVITTHPGPIHPADSFSAGGHTAMLDRHKLGQPAGGSP